MKAPSDLKCRTANNVASNALAMGSLKLNVAANFAGQAVSVLVALLAIPIYLRILGIESYGLIGFYLSLQAAFTVLDLGLALTLNRELARRAHSGSPPDECRDLVRTLEYLYWPIGILISLLVFLLSDWIATHWLNTVALDQEDAAAAIALMGLTTALQWPFALYQAGFRGLEKHVTLNILSSGAVILRHLASIAVVLFVSPTLMGFLVCQTVFAALQTVSSCVLLWRTVPKGSRAPRFNFRLLAQTRTFSLGLTGISVVSLLLMQSDKIILSSILTLHEFGYYTIATTVAAALSSVVGPIFHSFYPRYSGLVATGAKLPLATIYHQSNQLVAVLVSSAATLIALYAADILLLWTRDPNTAAASAPLLSLLVIATAIQGLAHLPYALQLAHGQTHLALRINIASIAFLVPSLLWLTPIYGGVAAACLLLALNLSTILVMVPLMHRRILPGEGYVWLWRDILPPVGAAAAAGLATKLLVPALPNSPVGVLLLGVIGITILVASCFGANSIRARLVGPLRHLLTP